MSDNLDVLVLNYAADHPADFARQIAKLANSGLATETQTLLNKLPASGTAAIIIHLPQPLAERILNESDNATVTNWITASSTNVAIGLLLRLPKKRRPDILNAIEQRERQRTLRRLIELPSSSVGALAETQVLRIRATGPVREAIHSIKTNTELTKQPAVAVDDNDRVLGFFDTSQALRLEQDAPARDCIIEAPSLYTETASALALDSPGWLHHAWLPIVDHQNRLFGLLSREKLLASAKSAADNEAGIDVMTAELGRSLLTVFTDLINLLLGRSTRS